VTRVLELLGFWVSWGCYATYVKNLLWHLTPQKRQLTGKQRTQKERTLYNKSKSGAWHGGGQIKMRWGFSVNAKS